MAEAAAAQRTKATSPARHAVPVVAPRRNAPGVDLLQRKEGACACGGSCPRCKEQMPLQTKLAVSQPGDALEREADRVADQVMGTTALGTGPVGSTDAPRQPLRMLQRQATGALDHVEAPPGVREALRSPGRPLDESTREAMESRFGFDFSGVRVHSDAAAARSAQSLAARAYTVGQDIVFGAGQYTPASREGQRLLAHELAHVVQQSGGDAGGAGIGRAPLGLHRAAQPQIMRALLFASTLNICHQYLRSRDFRVTDGGLRVVVNAHWGPREAGDPMPVGCRSDRPFSIQLREKGFIFDEPWGTCQFDAGGPSARQWTNLPSATYFLAINTPDTGPYCCLDGTIEVFQESGLTGRSCTQPPPGPLETLHTALDLAGLLPVIGAAADVTNAGLYVIQGDWANAGLSAVAVVPIFGDAAAVARVGGKTAVRVTGEGVQRVGRDGIASGLRRARASRSARSADDVGEAVERAFQEGRVTSDELIELVPHGGARRAREARGLSGSQAQSAHGAPQSAMRNLPHYDPDAALTRLLPRSVHQSMDAYWKQEARRLVREGRTSWTAQEMYQAVAESIRRTNGLSQAEKRSLIARLQDEIFVEWGLRPGDVVRLPYSR